jgi:hypothetical protein
MAALKRSVFRRTIAMANCRKAGAASDASAVTMARVIAASKRNISTDTISLAATLRSSMVFPIGCVATPMVGEGEARGNAASPNANVHPLLHDLTMPDRYSIVMRNESA